MTEEVAPVEVPREEEEPKKLWDRWYRTPDSYIVISISSVEAVFSILFLVLDIVLFFQPQSLWSSSPLSSEDVIRINAGIIILVVLSGVSLLMIVGVILSAVYSIGTFLLLKLVFYPIDVIGLVVGTIAVFAWTFTSLFFLVAFWLLFGLIVVVSLTNQVFVARLYANIKLGDELI